MTMMTLNLQPTRRQLKQFGLFALIGFGVVGGLIHWRGGLFGLDFGEAGRPLSFALAAAGILSAVLSLVAPTANRPIYVGLTLVTYPIGYVVSTAMLAVVFFGLLTPIGLLFRMIGRDPLTRCFEADRDSYWEPHRPPDSMQRYFRQF